MYSIRKQANDAVVLSTIHLLVLYDGHKVPNHIQNDHSAALQGFGSRDSESLEGTENLLARLNEFACNEDHMFRLGMGKTEIDQAAVFDEIVRLQKLIEDFLFIAVNGYPSPWSMDEALTLDDWRISYRDAPCLVGRVTGNPKFPGERRPIFTSELCLISEQQGYARTRSRSYVLGKPSGHGVARSQSDT